MLRARELEMKARLVGPVGIGPVPCVMVEDIEHVVSAWTGIPVERMSQDDRGRLLRLGTTLRVQAQPIGLLLPAFFWFIFVKGRVDVTMTLNCP